MLRFWHAKEDLFTVQLRMADASRREAAPMPTLQESEMGCCAKTPESDGETMNLPQEKPWEACLAAALSFGMLALAAVCL